jgi:hypothetical protein
MTRRLNGNRVESHSSHVDSEVVHEKRDVVSAKHNAWALDRGSHDIRRQGAVTRDRSTGCNRVRTCECNRHLTEQAFAPEKHNDKPEQRR